jgi:hypothetical protein
MFFSWKRYVLCTERPVSYLANAYSKKQGEVAPAPTSGVDAMIRRGFALLFAAAVVAGFAETSLADVSCGRCGCTMHTDQPQSSCWNCGRPLGGSSHYHPDHHHHPGHRPGVIYDDSGRFDGFNPGGGINTSGVTVYDSVNDPFRDSSRYNGTRRWVSRPMYNNRGQIVGYQEGYTWRNDVTGRWHFEGRKVTNNGLGGTNNQMEFKSGAPR